jgi:hypothetical protein
VSVAERRDRAAAARPYQPGATYVLAVALAWLVPGAGHWILGQKVRAVVLGVLLLGLFWWGEIGAQGWAVFYREHPYFYWGQVGNGLSTLLADKCQWGAQVRPPGVKTGIDRTIPAFLSTGILFTSISGLLNVLLVLHVMDPKTWERQAARGAVQPPADPRGPGAREEKKP